MRVAGDPPRLRGFASRTAPDLGGVADAAWDYRGALIGFTASANTVQPVTLDDLTPAVEQVLGEVEGIASLLTGLADRLEGADRGGGLPVLTGPQAQRAVTEVRGQRQDLLARYGRVDPVVATTLHGTRASVHGTRLVANVWSLRSQGYVPRDLGGMVTGRIGPSGPLADRLRPLTHGYRDEPTRQMADRFRMSRPLTATGRRIAEADSGPLRNIRLASRGLGVAGVGLSGYDAIQAGVEGDRERAAMSGLTAAGGAAMLWPPTAIAGAAVVGGVLLYENREAIADGARRLGRRVKGWFSRS